jgi:quercetin 2,3-dioxygenase
MSGPVDVKDVEQAAGAAAVEPEPATGAPARVTVSGSRSAQVGSMPVRRAIPNRGRRTVGAWCFADHFGPVTVDEHQRTDIGPHPHMGLQTVTWLLEGQLLHRDSLGTEQLIRPGELNLMTAGHGLAHAEETVTGYEGPAHGVQLWVALPSLTRDAPPHFEHHDELPRVELQGGEATVLVGSLAGAASPAWRDTDHAGADLALAGPVTTMPLEPAYEHALVVTSGAVQVDGTTVAPGALAYLGAGRDELELRCDEPSRLLLLGGLPFPEELFMWWNFVARTRDEVDVATADWSHGSARFGAVDSRLAVVPAPAPPWRRPVG